MPGGSQGLGQYQLPECRYPCGGVPILLPVTRRRSCWQAYADMCDGFLFSGGQDISPCRYNELPSRLTGPSSLLLDDYQLNLMKLVLDSKKPFIAICRGIQVLNVACGALSTRI